MVLITIVMGVYKPTYNWGASHCIYIYRYIVPIYPDSEADLEVSGESWGYRMGPQFVG